MKISKLKEHIGAEVTSIACFTAYWFGATGRFNAGR